MKFEWHPPKAASLFDDPHQYHYGDVAHSSNEQRYICLGFSEQTRLLMLVYTEPVRDTLRLISAREANASEEEDYEAQRYLT